MQVRYVDPVSQIDVPIPAPPDGTGVLDEVVGEG